MWVDHIFIFSQNKGKEADELLEAGLKEGSGRIHPGQGTRNRKFYFENCFLEILWVSNEWEIRDARTAKTQLWERANFSRNGNSPFGLCLINAVETDHIFADPFLYQPIYFPSGMPIEVLRHTEQPYLPWTFRFPFKGKMKKANEPRDHPLGVKELTKMTFGIKELDRTSKFVQNCEKLAGIYFFESTTHSLHLEFDQGKKGRKVVIESLGIEITY